MKVLLWIGFAWFVIFFSSAFIALVMSAVDAYVQFTLMETYLMSITSAALALPGLIVCIGMSIALQVKKLRKQLDKR
jgi:ABC-type dipeptide/oligopeptide/nickel transport system permease subunit